MMLQWVITGGVVLVCIGFWLKKLMPRVYATVCWQLANQLKRWGVLPRLQKRLERRPVSTGCGSCRSCDRNCH
ncbi:MAG: hypothetical protein IJ934_00420 [Acetobacter sp.]|nr:hypothetical protein [Acetobacter sp.]MBR2123635.1 hypothetical protein [Acetobacter sp.]